MALTNSASKKEALDFGGVQDEEPVVPVVKDPSEDSGKTRGVTPREPAVDSPVEHQGEATEAADNTIAWFDKRLEQMVPKADEFANSREDTGKTISDVTDEDAVNGMDRARTLRYARLADALNSQDWSYWRGGAVDATGRGQNTQGGLQGINVKDVDTAERRAQERAEELSQEKSLQTLGRQDLFKKYAYEMDKLRNETRAALASQASQVHLDAYRMMLQTVANEQYKKWDDAHKRAFLMTITNDIVNNMDERSRAIYGQLVGFAFPYSNWTDIQIELENRAQEAYFKATTPEEQRAAFDSWQKTHSFLTSVAAAQQAGGVKAGVNAAKNALKEQ